MFVLNQQGGGAAGGSGASSSTVQNLYFFGRLGVYFAILRGAFMFMDSRQQRFNDKVALLK